MNTINAPALQSGKTLQIVVEIDGTICFVHDDELADLLDEGQSTLKRASHIEPDEHGQWFADLSPVDGETLGPFRLRGDALEAEKQWLHMNRL